ncbi:MAG TPA: hypothetical protein VF073_03745 [Gaiella sp.]
MTAALAPPIRHVAAVIGVAAVAMVAAAPAQSSELIGRNATGVRVQADAQGRALITFRSEGQTRQLLAWGAVNARAPSQGVPQVAFQLSYGGSIGRNVCGAYRGPPLAWKVAACTTPDGTHWALQAWQRMLPNYGVTPTGTRGASELRLSHWSGQVARLEIWADWSYRRFHHLYGRLTYGGQGVYGFRSTRFGVPLDTYGRNVFVDTLGSAYGPGWQRENSFLTHAPGGGFCYGFYAHGGHGVGNGTRYRATVIGPGVTPDVMWQGPSPAAYDAAADNEANAHQRSVLGADARCTIN